MTGPARGVAGLTITGTPLLSHSLIFEPISPGDEVAQLSIYDKTGDGPSVMFNAALLRYAAAQLVRRADWLEGGVR